jgi:hypothetical protein
MSLIALLKRRRKSASCAGPATVEVLNFAEPGRKRKRSSSSELASASVREARARLPCFECGKVGHLVAECPQRAASNAAKALLGGRGGSRGGSGGGGEEFDARDCWRTVQAISATTLTGKKRREWEAEEVEKQGGWAKKKAKVPFKILIGMRKKQAERERKHAERVRESGIVVALAPKPKKKKGKPKKERKY